MSVVVGILIGLFFLAIFVGSIVGFVLLVRYIIRSFRERKALIEQYARERNLSLAMSGALPAVTPLLRHGGGGSPVMKGALPGGLDGTLAVYRYTTGSGDNRQTHYFTVVISELPESARIGSLYCEHVKLGALAALGEALTGVEHVAMESTAFETSYRVQVPDGADHNMVRQIFEPSFIVYLVDQAPERLGFELENGMLCVYVHGGLWDEPAQMDALCGAAARIAGRLREEIAEPSVRTA